MSMRKMVLGAAMLAGLTVAGSASAQQTTTPAAAATPAAPDGAPAAAAPAPLPWRGTQLLTTFGVTLPTIFRDMNLTPNDTVDMTLILRPRWTFNRWVQLRGGLAFSYEFTNSDTTTTQHEPRFGDANLDLWITGIPPLGGAVKFWVAPRLVFPVSPESRARTLIVTPAVVVQAAYSVEHVLGGEFELIANATYSHPLYEYTTPGRRTPLPYQANCFGSGAGGSCSDQLSGGFNPSNTLSWAVIIAQSWTHVSPGVYFAMQHIWDYTGTNVNLVNNSPTSRRTNTIFAAWIDWNVNTWFTAEFGYQVFRNLLDGDGNWGNPFYAPYQDTRFYIQGIFSLDKIYEAIAGRSEHTGGVLRTRNHAPGQFAMF